MFTGIIEEIGRIQSIKKNNKSVQIGIMATEIINGTKIGESIAVNGVCLTVSSVGSNNFIADVMPETIDKTSLYSLTTGSLINLERAMPSNGRFGGHIVSGHIDGVGTIVGRYTDDIALWLEIKATSDIMRYIINKGSICLDGTSLTVAGLNEDTFKVSLIPHTRKLSVLGEKKVGEAVNIECDIIGKYIEKLLNLDCNKDSQSTKKLSITSEFLKENGFL